MPGNLSLTETPQTEGFEMPCNVPAGNPVTYKLDPFHWTPDVQAHQQPHISFGFRDPGYALGLTKLPAIFDAPFGPSIDTSPSFDLSGGPDTVALGTLLANNVAPTIDPIGSFSGNEGSPVQFSASTHSQCPIDSYVWDFSDGTKSFGPNPQRKFADNGVYDGQLVVTDETGLSATRSFSAVIGNCPVGGRRTGHDPRLGQAGSVQRPGDRPRLG